MQSLRHRTAALLVLLPALAFSQTPNRREIIRERAKMLAGFAGSRSTRANAETIKQADAIASGTVFFYSRTPVNVGLKDIDWTGKHIKHQEWPAQLNRFFHLGPLAAAYRTTKDERYARAARAYIEDWLREDPYATSRTTRPGDNTLNISVRLGSSHSAGWGATLPVFLDSPSFDDAFVDRMLASMANQARFLKGHLTAVGNWRISQLDAIIFTALRFPFLPESKELLEFGSMGMRNALATQFLSDGVHIERTPGYHDWMADVLANYTKLAGIFPEVNVKADTKRLMGALDYSAQSELFGVNDSIAPHRDRALSRLERRAEWMRTLNLQGTATPPLDQVFDAAGQAFSRTAWEPGADMLAFDASSWGGGHGHLSRLSFVFRSQGRMMVADPGILTYEMSDPMGPYGKSTAAHSTLNIGGRNQSGADAVLQQTAFTKDIALIQARYQGGYWDGAYTWSFGNGRGAGTWADHQRIVFWAKGDYVLSIDSMFADEGADIRNVWQLGPMTKWTHDEKTLTWRSQNDDGNLALQMALAPEAATMSVVEGERNPPRGWVGWHANDGAPAPLVEFRYKARRGRPNLSAVLIAAAAGKQQPAFTVKSASSHGAISRLEIARPDGGVDTIAWSQALDLPVDDNAPFVTDGVLVWCRTAADGKVIKRFVLRGSYLKRNGTGI